MKKTDATSVNKTPKTKSNIPTTTTPTSRLIFPTLDSPSQFITYKTPEKSILETKEEENRNKTYPNSTGINPFKEIVTGIDTFLHQNPQYTKKPDDKLPTFKKPSSNTGFRIADLESKLKIEQGKLKRKVEEVEYIKEFKTSELLEAKDRINKLEGDRLKLFNREKEARMIVEKKDAEILNLNNQLEEFKTRIKNSEQNFKTEKFELINLNKCNVEKFEKSLQKLKLDLIEKENCLKKSLLMIQKKSEELDNVTEKLKTYETEKVDNNPKTQKKLSKDEETMFITQLKEKILKIEELEDLNFKLKKEVNYFKSIQENVQKLKYEKEDLILKLKDFETFKKKFVKIECENLQLVAEKSRWLNYLDNGEDLGDDARYIITKRLEEQRILNTALSQSVNEKSNILKRVIEEKESADKEIHKLNEEIDTLKLEILRYSNAVKRAERSKGFVEKEVEFLKKQVKSYESGELRHLEGKTFDEKKENYIKGLEEVNSNLKRALDDLESENKKIQIELTKLNEEVRRSENNVNSFDNLQLEKKKSKISELEQEIFKLNNEKKLKDKEINALNEQIFILEKALGHGHYDSSKTKVLELMGSPEHEEFSYRKEFLEKLLNENKKLRELLSNTEKKELTDLLPKQSFELLELEKEKLKNSLSDKIKYSERLKVIYQENIIKYREAVKNFTGYNINLEARDKISIKYQNFKFIWTIDQGFQILNPQENEENFKIKLQEFQNCIPIFLAWILLNYNNI
ncbi:hypothetical protein HDU92_003633 [Lobulomyces angularis]|nr:hypothetical protein HDU92_003633 [Lobulomyces angularis]